MSRLQTRQCDHKACAGELGSFAVLLRGETESVASAASLGLNSGKKGTKLHLCQQWEPGMSLQQQPGCWGGLKASLPGLISYTENGFILSSAVSL